MKINKWITVLLLIVFVSCAHKSGRHEINKSNPIQGSSQISKTQDQDLEISDIPVSTNPNESIIFMESNLAERKKLDGAEIFRRYNPAVFMVFTTDGYQGYQGSGFFISSDGWAVSNYHVFQGTNVGAECIKLSGSDVIYKVTDILARSEDEDFILFKVNITNNSYLPIAQYKPNVGEKVYAIGSPLGLENTFSSGEISQWRDHNLMQISTQIDRGSSGGALINEYGEVVGITSGTFADGSQANLNYAWSIDAIKPYIKFN